MLRAIQQINGRARVRTRVLEYPQPDAAAFQDPCSLLRPSEAQRPSGKPGEDGGGGSRAWGRGLVPGVGQRLQN